METDEKSLYKDFLKSQVVYTSSQPKKVKIESKAVVETQGILSDFNKKMNNIIYTGRK